MAGPSSSGQENFPERPVRAPARSALTLQLVVAAVEAIALPLAIEMTAVPFAATDPVHVKVASTVLAL